MNKIHEQPSNGLQNAEETPRENYSDKLITNEPIEGTPFRLVGNLSQGYAITLGKYRLTEPKKTVMEALQPIVDHDWNLIANTITTILDTYKEIENEINK